MVPAQTAKLEAILMNTGIKVNRKKMPGIEALRKLRSYYSLNSKTLFLNKGLNDAQENFLIGREIGFQFLGITDQAHNVFN